MSLQFPWFNKAMCLMPQRPLVLLTNCWLCLGNKCDREAITRLGDVIWDTGDVCTPVSWTLAVMGTRGYFCLVYEDEAFMMSFRSHTGGAALKPNTMCSIYRQRCIFFENLTRNALVTNVDPCLETQRSWRHFHKTKLALSLVYSHLCPAGLLCFMLPSGHLSPSVPHADDWEWLQCDMDTPVRTTHSWGDPHLPLVPVCGHLLHWRHAVLLLRGLCLRVARQVGTSSF